jgi:predicted porin
MKKSLLAVAVFGALASAGAQAQTSVTMYGVADAFVENIKAGDNKFGARVGSGGLNGSRWGVRGTEDLGGGLKGKFVIEAGISLDTGTSGQGSNAASAAAFGNTAAVNRTFGRQAFVGLEGGFGELRFGRQYTPIGNIADMVGTGSYDVLGNASAAGDLAYRTDNAVNYITPNFGGFSAEVQWSPQVVGAEQSDATGNKKLGAHAGVNLKFVNGPISAGLGYLGVQDADATANNDTKLTSILGNISYAFGPAKVGLFYNSDELDGAGSTAATIAGLTVGATLGSTDLQFVYAALKDLSGDETINEDDASYFKLQAAYNLSKRTAAYVQYASFRNKAGSDLGLSGVSGPAGEDPAGVRFGIRHFF